MSQNGKWQSVIRSLCNASVPFWLIQGIVEILDKAGYGLREASDRAAPMMYDAINQGQQRYTLDEAVDIEKAFTRLCRRYDTQMADPSHYRRVAAYAYTRFAVLQENRPQSAALLLTWAQRVQ